MGTEMLVHAILGLLLLPASAAPAEEVFTATGAFRVAYPPQYALRPGLREAIPNAELIGTGPETGILLRVERYEKGGRLSLPRDRFVSQLLHGIENPVIGAAKVSGAGAEVFKDIPMGYVRRRLPDHDPYWRVLGHDTPPRLGFFSLTRFHFGGEAHKRWRCKRWGVWKQLAQYEALREKPAELAEFKQSYLELRDPRYANTVGDFPERWRTCVGWEALQTMRAGESVARWLREPTLRELRRMARAEQGEAAEFVGERMSVAVVPYAGGYYALRYRAPEELYKKHYARFERLLETFTLEPAPSTP